MELITLQIMCPFCCGLHYVQVYEADYILWRRGMNAQTAFPYLNDTEREQLISHACPECQVDIFGD